MTDASGGPADSQLRLLRELRRRLRDAGMFGPPGRVLVVKPIGWCAAFVASYLGLLGFRTGLEWLGCVFVSSLSMLALGILAHECGHRSISRRAWVNALWGYVGMSLATGLSFSRWRHWHDEHHRACQDETQDPDMQFGVVLSVHETSDVDKTGVGRLIRPAQAFYFWPITFLYWITMRWDGLVHLLQHRRCAAVDAIVLPLHYALWIALPAHVLGWRLAVMNYVVASSLLAAATALLFVVNHIGMPILRRGHGAGYLAQQIECSRNIETSPVWDHLFGGLNFHIEHHLFPRIGHDKLRRAAAIVRAFCHEHGLRYRSEPFSTAIRGVAAHLHAMSKIEPERADGREATDVGART